MRYVRGRFPEGFSCCTALRPFSTGRNVWSPKRSRVLDASYAFSLQVHHKKLFQNPQEKSTCEKIQREAWVFLQNLSDEEIEACSALDVAELLASWVYFSKFWENGMNGPSVASAGSLNLSSEREPLLHIPAAMRDVGTGQKRHMEDRSSLPPRGNPLDEVILEF